MPPAQKAEWLFRPATTCRPQWQSGSSGSDWERGKLFQCRRQIMLLLCNPSNEHGRLAWSLVSGQLFLFLTALLLSGSRDGAGSRMHTGKARQNGSMSAVRIWGFGNLLPPAPGNLSTFCLDKVARHKWCPRSLTNVTGPASVDVNVHCRAETAISNWILYAAVEANRKPEWFCHRRLLSLRLAATGSLCLTGT